MLANFSIAPTKRLHIFHAAVSFYDTSAICNVLILIENTFGIIYTLQSFLFIQIVLLILFCESIHFDFNMNCNDFRGKCGSSLVNTNKVRDILNYSFWVHHIRKQLACVSYVIESNYLVWARNNLTSFIIENFCLMTVKEKKKESLRPPHWFKIDEIIIEGTQTCATHIHICEICMCDEWTKQVL